MGKGNAHLGALRADLLCTRLPRQDRNLIEIENFHESDASSASNPTQNGGVSAGR